MQNNSYKLSRKYLSFFLTAVILSQLVFGTAMAASKTFADISTSPQRESIEYLAAKGLVAGYSDGSFKPDAVMTRAEFTTVIVQAFKNTEIGNRADCFSDVHDEWFAKYVCYAKEFKLVSGHPDGSFNPAGNVSYVEAVAIAVAGAKIEVLKNPTQKQWYEHFLNFAHVNSIFSKYSMLPSKLLTRAQASFVIHQMLLIADGTKKLTTIRKNYSAGCSATPPATPPTSISVNGVTRTMISAVPATYNKNTPIKLVFAIHGRTNSNTMVRGYYKVEQAATGKAIMVYPSGLKAGSGYSWGASDIPFFDALLSKFSAEYCIDLDEVFVVGHSLGGWMTSELACTRGDVIRGIANVGGGATKHANCSGPVAAMIWHNPKDNLVAYSQGIIARDAIKSQNQLGEKYTPVEPTEYHCVAYTDGQPSALLVWCPHTQDYETYGAKQYYPHLWPKNAGADIWKFFEGLN